MIVKLGQSIQTAINTAAPGAIIDVQAGTYSDQFLTISRNVTLQGIGGMVHLTENMSPPNLKGMILVGTPGLIPGDAPNVTINDFEISGVNIPVKFGDNGAAIRWQSGNLNLSDDWFWGNQEGLLGTTARGTGVLNIQSSEFNNNGTTGQTHGIYVGYAYSVTINNSYFHDTIAGHEIKSRAEHNVLTNDRIFGNNSTDSMQIDFPNGGADIVSNDMIQKGLHSENPRFIAFGEGPILGVGTEWAGSSLTLSHDTFDNQYGPEAQALWNPADLPIFAVDNSFYDIAPLGVGSMELSNPPKLDLLHPWL